MSDLANKALGVRELIATLCALLRSLPPHETSAYAMGNAYWRWRDEHKAMLAETLDAAAIMELPALAEEVMRLREALQEALLEVERGGDEFDSAVESRMRAALASKPEKE